MSRYKVYPTIKQEALLVKKRASQLSVKNENNLLVRVAEDTFSVSISCYKGHKGKASCRMTVSLCFDLRKL